MGRRCFCPGCKSGYDSEYKRRRQEGTKMPALFSTPKISMPEMSDERDRPIVPSGWKREIRRRKSGKTAGKVDIYFYNPEQKVFRSKKSLKLYLEQTLSPLKITDFDFCLQDDGKNQTLTAGNEMKTSLKNSDQKDTTGKIDDVYKDNSFICPETEVTPTAHANTDVKDELPCPKNISLKIQGRISNRRTPCKRSPYFSYRIRQLHESVPNYFRNLSKWDPPRSPYNLMQEDLYHDPWKMLVATICLQKTTGKAVKKVISQFFEKFPTPQLLLQSQPSEITHILQPLGLQEKKSKILLRFSDEYLNKQWKYPIELHGIGKYGNDSYRIFCINEWQKVVPKDHMLEKYHKWLLNQSCEP